MQPDRANSFDIIIIGGGAAGMMAGLSVKRHHPTYTVLILDQSLELGRKLLVSGAGRGNLTNKKLAAGPGNFFHGDRTLVASVFQQFGYHDMVNFFDNLGIPLYEEQKTSMGKMFPVCDHAKTVRNVLAEALLEKGISILCNTPVLEINKEHDQWCVYTKNQKYLAQAVILTTGGKTYPALGSDGSGYGLASSIGHTVIPPVVSAVPLVSKNMLSHLLQGEKWNMGVVSSIAGKEMMRTSGDVMFTKYGFSGPAILDVSREISIRINREGVHGAALELSFFPQSSFENVETIVKQRFAKHPTYPVSHCLLGILTEKIAGAVCAVSGIPKDRTAKEIHRDEIQRLLGTLIAYRVEVSDTRGWNEGEFTAGGVDGSEIDPQTLESKKAKGLYLAGEILDVDGPVGGFNLSWSWASGWVAGKLQ